jgi:hypothetical protein
MLGATYYAITIVAIWNHHIYVSILNLSKCWAVAREQIRYELPVNLRHCPCKRPSLFQRVELALSL